MKDGTPTLRVWCALDLREIAPEVVGTDYRGRLVPYRFTLTGRDIRTEVQADAIPEGALEACRRKATDIYWTAQRQSGWLSASIRMIKRATDEPIWSIRSAIATALDIVVQVTRGSDGKRRIVEVAEVGTMEGETVSMQTLFRYVGEGDDGDRGGVQAVVENGYACYPMRPLLWRKAQLHGCADRMADALGLHARG